MLRETAARKKEIEEVERKTRVDEAKALNAEENQVLHDKVEEAK